MAFSPDVSAAGGQTAWGAQLVLRIPPELPTLRFYGPILAPRSPARLCGTFALVRRPISALCRVAASTAVVVGRDGDGPSRCASCRPRRHCERAQSPTRQPLPAVQWPLRVVSNAPSQAILCNSLLPAPHPARVEGHIPPETDSVSQPAATVGHFPVFSLFARLARPSTIHYA